MLHFNHVVSCFKQAYWKKIESVSHLILSDSLWPHDCSPPGSSLHVISQARSNEVGGHCLLQGIFPTQESNPSLPHCRQYLYCLSQQGKKVHCVMLSWLLVRKSKFNLEYAKKKSEGGVEWKTDFLMSLGESGELSWQE